MIDDEIINSYSTIKWMLFYFKEYSNQLEDVDNANLDEIMINCRDICKTIACHRDILKTRHNLTYNETCDLVKVNDKF